MAARTLEEFLDEASTVLANAFVRIEAEDSAAAAAAEKAKDG